MAPKGAGRQPANQLLNAGLKRPAKAAKGWQEKDDHRCYQVRAPVVRTQPTAAQRLLKRRSPVLRKTSTGD